jgi:hypothetical protein
MVWSNADSPDTYGLLTSEQRAARARPAPQAQNGPRLRHRQTFTRTPARWLGSHFMKCGLECFLTKAKNNPGSIQQPPVCNDNPK